VKRLLTRNKKELWRYDGEGQRITDGSLPPSLRGDCTGLSGDCTYLRGNCTDLSGDLDACGITDKERNVGMDITTLVSEEKADG
jgi:hypothetical protein